MDVSPIPVRGVDEFGVIADHRVRDRARRVHETDVRPRDPVQ
jgi:hypothetical protein